MVLIGISLVISDVEHLFHVPVGHLYIFFGKMFRSRAHLLNGLCGFLATELYEFTTGFLMGSLVLCLGLCLT